MLDRYVEMPIPEKTSLEGEAGESIRTFVPRLLSSLEVKRYYLRRYTVHTNDAFDEEFGFRDTAGLPENVMRIGDSVNPKTLVSLSSRVETTDGEFHLPLLDFSSSVVTELNVIDAEATLKRLGQDHGYLVRSGRSFHYYGVELLTSDEWLGLMNASASEPAIGPKYIRNQLRRGASYLRQNTSAHRPFFPEIVKEFRI